MPTPGGYHTVTPRIFTEDPAGLVAFMKHVFGADGEFHSDRPSEIRIGDSMLMIAGTEQRDPMPAFLYVYVDDVDTTYRRAIDAGAESIEPPADQPYGDRRAMVRDTWDNYWQIASRR